MYYSKDKIILKKMMIYNVMHADVFDKLNSEVEWIDDVLKNVCVAERK
jgi:hypothetical protein